MKKRKDIPTIICRGCGHAIQGEEVITRPVEPPVPAQTVINWTCQNKQCPYGPKTIPVGDELED